MHVTNHKVQQWYRSYRRLFLTRGYWLVLAGLVLAAGSIFSLRGSGAEKTFLVLFAADVALVFCLVALYVALTGLSMFYERKKTDILSALCGLTFGFFGSVFLAYIAIMGLIKAIH